MTDSWLFHLHFLLDIAMAKFTAGAEAHERKGASSQYHSENKEYVSVSTEGGCESWQGPLATAWLFTTASGPQEKPTQSCNSLHSKLLEMAGC